VRVLVCGSRSWQDIHAIRRRLSELPPESTVIQGGAPGADSIARMIADDLGFTTATYHANWRRDGNRAGLIRNLRMLNTEPNLVLAFWDGESRGTAHTIREAEKRGIPVEVIRAQVGA
jgi:hypothetical protein